MQWGDQALQRVASCLLSSVRETDTVSRHGGDEFLILLAEVSQAADAVLVAERVMAALAAVSRIGDHELSLTAGVGISMYPDDGEDARTLVDRADTAMYLEERHNPVGFAIHGGAVPSGRRMPAPGLDPARRSPQVERAVAEHERRNSLLREANERLVQATLGAQELQVAAEQAQRRQTEFLKGVANELSSPLAPIRIATTMLGRLRSDEPLLPRARAIIEQQVKQMSRLFGGALDAGQASTQVPTLERRAVDVLALLEVAIDACRPAMDRRGQTLALALPAGPIEVQGDPARLGPAFSNLLSNATR